MSLAIILRWSHLSSGCSTSLHKFWCRHSGSWFKWGAEAMEVEKQWTKSKWEGDVKIVNTSTNDISPFLSCMHLCRIYNASSMCSNFMKRFLTFSMVQKATASVVPQHWQPNSGLLMTNDVPENCEEAVPCIALSKNDSYVMSACGGKVSLFNMMTFKVIWYWCKAYKSYEGFHCLLQFGWCCLYWIDGHIWDENLLVCR